MRSEAEIIARRQGFQERLDELVGASVARTPENRTERLTYKVILRTAIAELDWVLEAPDGK